MLYKFVFIYCILLFHTLTQANVPPEKFDFRIGYDEKSKMAKISAYVERGTYFAIGFGSTMRDTGMIIMQADKDEGRVQGLRGHGSDGVDSHATPMISKQ